MNICIDAREFVKDKKTGISRYLENLLLPLKNKSEHEFTLLGRDPSFLPDSLKNSRIKYINIPNAPTLITDQYLLPKLARKNNADIFFSPYYKVPLCGNFKRIITVHDIMFLKLKSFGFKHCLTGIQLRLATGKADIILTDSEFSKNDLCEYLPNISNKIKVVYPAISPAWNNPSDRTQSTEIRNKYSDGQPFLLYVGNFKPHKNVNLLIDAFLDYTSRVKNNHRLLLAGGDTVNFNRINEYINAKDKNNVIKTYPYVSEDELKALYSAADWFISVSKYEGFGYPLLEAMVSGCPVIYYPCTSIPEVTENIPVQIEELTMKATANAISKAFDTSTDERFKLIQQGRQKAEKFSRSESSEMFQTIIKSMM